MQTTIFNKWLNHLKALAFMILMVTIVASCKKNNDMVNNSTEVDNQQEAVNAARQLETSAPIDAKNEATSLGFDQLTNSGSVLQGTIVDIAVGNPNFSSLVAAVLKTELAGALSDASANLTVFAPTNGAFAQLPAPFNNAANINGISDPAQIDFLRNVLLYHVLGAEVFSNQVSNGASSAETIKPSVSGNDNTIYLSKTFGLIRVNGQSTVIYPNLDASNGVIHVINKVLLFPTNTIAGIAIGNAELSSLVAALVKTNLAGVFAGTGDFSVFAPTNAAFAQLPSPFNNATNIGNITDAAQIAALSNILRYHVIGSRNFTWDLGILTRVTTLADAPKNKVTTILGYNTGWVKGDDNNSFARINPADILATNGVIHVIGKVLLPKN
ncbi:MAG: fasciclin domain-containing protein [Ferruginibacter sp.]